jgi:hypothetical protein
MANPFSDPNFGADLNPFSDPEFGRNAAQDVDQKKKQPERTIGGTIADIGVSAAKGVVGAGEAVVGLADIPTLGRAGKALESIGYDPQATHRVLDAEYSPAQKWANQEVSDAEGFVDTAKAALANPSTIGHSVIESLPVMVGGGAIGGAARKLAPAISPIMAGAVGEGVAAAGSSAESTRQQTEEGVLSVGQDAAAVLSGAGTALFGAVGGRLAKKFGLEDADTYLARLGSGEKSAAKGVGNVAARIIGGGISEGVFEELPQSVQETMWQNAALGKDLLDGVPEAAAQGLLAGAAMGGGFNALTGRKEASPVEAAPAEVYGYSGRQEPIDTAELDRKIANLETTAKASPRAQENLDALKAEREMLVGENVAAVEPVMGDLPDYPSTATMEDEYQAYQPELPGDVAQPEAVDPTTGEILAPPVSEAPTFDQEPEERQVSMPGRPTVLPAKEVGDLSSLEFTEPLAKGKKRLTKEEIDAQNEANRKLFEPAPKTTKEYSAVISGLERAIPRESERTKDDTEGKMEPLGEFSPSWYRKPTIEAFDAKHGTNYAKTVTPFDVMAATRRLAANKPLVPRHEAALAYINDYAAREHGANSPEMAAEAAAPGLPIITAKNGRAIVNEAAAKRAAGKRMKTHDVVKASTLRPGEKGFILVPKQKEDLAGRTGLPTSEMDDPDNALAHFENAIPQADRAAMADVFAYIRQNNLHRQASFAQQLFNMVGGMYEKRTGRKLAILGGSSDNISRETPNELDPERRETEGGSRDQGNGAEGAGPGTRQEVSGDAGQASAGPAGTERPAVENNTPDASDASAPSGVTLVTSVTSQEAIKAQPSQPGESAPASSLQFTVEPLGAKSIIALGDTPTLRAKLKDAGFAPTGIPNTKRGGLVFAKKHEAAVRAALIVSPLEGGREWAAKTAATLSPEEALSLAAQKVAELKRTSDHSVRGKLTSDARFWESARISSQEIVDDATGKTAKREAAKEAIQEEIASKAAAKLAKIKKKSEAVLSSAKETPHAQTDKADTVAPVAQADNAELNTDQNAGHFNEDAKKEVAVKQEDNMDKTSDISGDKTGDNLTASTREAELENARAMLAKDPENALKLALVQQAKERLEAERTEPSAGVAIGVTGDDIARVAINKQDKSGSRQFKQFEYRVDSDGIATVAHSVTGTEIGEIELKTGEVTPVQEKNRSTLEDVYRSAKEEARVAVIDEKIARLNDYPALNKKEIGRLEAEKTTNGPHDLSTQDDMTGDKQTGESAQDMQAHRERLLAKAAEYDEKSGYSITDATPADYAPGKNTDESVDRYPEQVRHQTTEEQQIRASINEARTLLKGKILPAKRVEIEASLVRDKKKLARIIEKSDKGVALYSGLDSYAIEGDNTKNNISRREAGEYGRRVETLTGAQQGNYERAEREAAGYLRGLPGTVLGNNIAKSFKDQSKINLIGQRVESLADLAIIGQIFRNPSFETNRYVFVKDGRVVNITGVTSRLPGASAAFIGGATLLDGVDQIQKMGEKSGADGFYLLHNHPSGNPTPSAQDKETTLAIAAELPDLFLGHVVINHDSYATIQGFDVQVKPLPASITQAADRYGKNEPSTPHPILGMKINSVDHLAGVAAQLQGAKETFQVIGVSGGESLVTGIMDVPVEKVSPLSKIRMAGMLRKFARATGSTRLFAVNVPDNSALNFEEAVKTDLLHDVHLQSGEFLANRGIRPEVGMLSGRKGLAGHLVREDSAEYVGSPMSLENLEEVADFVEKRGKSTTKKKKKDFTFWQRLLSTPAYYFKDVPAMGRMFDVVMNRQKAKFAKESEILGAASIQPLGHGTYLATTGDGTKQEFKSKEEASAFAEKTDFTRQGKKLKESAPDEYEAVKEYLKETDQSGYSFKLRMEGDQYKVLSPAGKMVGEFFNDRDKAIAFLYDQESEYLEKIGFAPEGVNYIRLGRELTNRALNELRAEMVQMQSDAKEAGLPDPFASGKTIDEAGRYGIYAEGQKEPVALFATEQQAADAMDRLAEMQSWFVMIQGGGSKVADPVERMFKDEAKAKAWARKRSGTVRGQKAFGNLRVKQRTDAEMRPMTVKQSIAAMDELVGSYMPRQRRDGAYVLVAKKDGENPIRKPFDADLRVDDTDEKPGWRDLVNQLSPNGREASRLTKQGYDVTVEKDASLSEDVFSAPRLVASLDAVLDSTMSVVDKKDSADIKASQHINLLLTQRAAAIIQQRGFLSSRMHRVGGDVWEGYEDDPQKALIQYAKGVAAGVAKRDMARDLMLAFTGRDVSWDAWEEKNPGKEYGEYLDFVKDRGVDASLQKNAYRDGVEYIVDMLRNDEQLDRIVGTMKGLAVQKFLAFRVSSAAVNLTNMVTGVPGTMSSALDITPWKAFAHIGKAATAYGKYLSGKGTLSAEDRGILQEITNRGLDDAQYNAEAARELRTEFGDKWNTFTTWGMALFGITEKANRAMTIFAAYKAAQEKHPELSEPDLWEKAEEISSDAHGRYDKGDRPAFTRGGDLGRILGLNYVFAKFGHNYLLNARKQFFANAPEEMGLDRYLYWDRQRTAAAYLMLSPAILAGAGASLPVSALMALAQAMGIGGDDPEEEYYKWAEDTFGSDAFARQGLAGMIGINLKGSLQANNPIPTKLSELGGAPGAVATDTWKGVKHLAKGEVWKGVEALVPTGFGSAFKAAREATEGITTSNYGQVFYGDEPLKADSLDAALRFFSFNPARLSGIREKQWNEKQVAAKYQERRSEINNQIKREFLQGKGITPEALKEIARYNELALGAGRPDIRPITMNSIRNMLRQNAKPSKFERTRAA